MSTSFRTATWFRLGISALLGLSCVGATSASFAAKVEDRIAAIVNSDLIMLSEVRRELAPERERLEKHYRGEELSRRLQMAEAMALTTMIERRLQLQEAKARSVEVGDQEVKQAVKQLIQQGEKIDDKDPVSTNSVRDQLTLLKVVDREVRSGVMVADPEMKRYYQEHRDRFALPEEYTLSQILIKPRSADEVADARAKGREVTALLKQGESFEDLALRYSDGPTASRGGRLGLVRQGELLPAIERGVSNLVPGGISDIIESPEGLHIVRLDDKKPKQFRPFEEVRQEIQALVFQQKSEDMFQSWLADLKNKAYIEIKFDSAPLRQTTSVPAPPPSPTSKP
ncbi:MAG: putative Peptidylprolyl isomerase [Nitrospira sp.]|jgi:peptidyl-prolyl cis-trans isomerase SurA|nr:putative Peptidylprolyl isomerase [Nitrospira sp.]